MMLSIIYLFIYLFIEFNNSHKKSLQRPFIHFYYDRPCNILSRFGSEEAVAFVRGHAHGGGSACNTEVSPLVAHR